jgi:DNA-binding NarL/FixJ family response regulator
MEQGLGSTVEPGAEATALNQETTNGAELLHLAEALCACQSLPELEQMAVACFCRLMGAPRCALYILDARSGLPMRVASVNFSDTFLSRYERMREGRDTDPLYAHVLTTGEAAYSRTLMSADEWLKSPFYTKISRLQGCRQLVQVPLVDGTGIVGTVTLGMDDAGHEYTSHELKLAEAVGRLVGIAIERVTALERLKRECHQALAALDHTGAAVVISDPNRLEPHLNEAARQLLVELVDGEEQLHHVIARPRGAGGFSRRVTVTLTSGEEAILRAHSNETRRDGRTLVTVLELEREQPRLSPGPLSALTAREREVAVLIAGGLSDRVIAERLRLSHHTVSQYAKRIYRKLEVGSRVALTRLLLDVSPSDGCLTTG